MTRWVLIASALFAFLAGTTSAWAQNRCEDLFSQSRFNQPEIQQISEIARQKHLTAENYEALSGNIKTLAIEIFHQNHEVILSHARTSFEKSKAPNKDLYRHILTYDFLRDDLTRGDLEVQIKPQKFLKGSNLHDIEVSFVLNGARLFYYNLRTNGHAAFLHISFMYRRDGILNDFTAVALKEGQLIHASMSDMVLASLSEEVTISRTMNSAERDLWIQGHTDRLGSKAYDRRVHFALNYYYFNRPPYMAKVPRAVLEKLYLENKMEINSYDIREQRPVGMPPEARTSFGVEIEFVFTREALRDLSPYLSPAFRQGVLDFEDFFN